MTIFLTRDSGLVCLLHWLFEQDPRQATTYIYDYINIFYYNYIDYIYISG